MYCLRDLNHHRRIHKGKHAYRSSLSLTNKLHMNQRQWQEVEAIVRKEQERALQHLNNARYNELTPILDHLYTLAHGSNQSKDT